MADQTIYIPPNERNESEATTLEILEKLRNPGAPVREKRKDVLAAEILDFQEDQTEELCALLHDFVLQYRNSNVAEDLIAVGSAVRKLVAYLPHESLGRLAELLDAGSRIPVSLETELEITKTIVRKLTNQPPEKDDPEPELGERLQEIAQAYVNPRLLPREKYGATALNAVLGLALLRSPHFGETIEMVRACNAAWFTQLLCRRVARISDYLRERVSAEEFPTVTRSLRELADVVGEQSS